MIQNQDVAVYVAVFMIVITPLVVLTIKEEPAALPKKRVEEKSFTRAVTFVTKVTDKKIVGATADYGEIIPNR